MSGSSREVVALSVRIAVSQDCSTNSECESERTVNDARLPLFCDTALAERIERVEAQLIAAPS
jgi:hypothetical protein